MKLKKTIITALMLCAATSPAWAAEYIIDTKGAHASIDFRFKHLNISWLTGEFKDFDGSFTYDPTNPSASSVEVNIRTASIDSNHAERDKHMRGEKFLDTEKYPNAKFVSTKVVSNGDGKATVYGDLTLRGVTREIAIDANLIGEGKDPWGGYRAGFEGTVTLNTQDFGMKMAPTNQVEMSLNLEGIQKK